LEQEGQVTYVPRRGYFVTELNITDLKEIYELRRVLEGRAVRHTLPALDEDALHRVAVSAKVCAEAAESGDVAGMLDANRRFHFGMLEAGDNPHHVRLIQLLWDSTEAYRALYYNSPDEQRIAIEAHERILRALDVGDPNRLVAELDAHRNRTLAVLRWILGPSEPEASELWA
jgi:DNA-binding GntR family transcriptional regulator